MYNQSSNIPVSATSEADFISKVYLWMAAGLGLTALTSFLMMSQPALLQQVIVNRWVFFGLIIAQLGLVFWLSARIMSMSLSLATFIFFLYSMLTGVTLTPIVLVYTSSSIFLTFGVTAGTFLFFSIYGRVTRQDLTKVGNLCFMGLIGVVIAGVVNIFLKSTMVYWISTFLGIAVFLGLIAWDTQKLKLIHAQSEGNEDLQRRGAIIGALALYLDFINLFIMLLRVLGKRRS